MRVVDGEHAVGAGDADLERVDRARPRHRQRPRDVEVIDRAVAHHDHAGGGVDALVERAQHLVDRARVAFDRRLRFEVPHAHVERVRAGDHHRRDRRRIVGALVVVDRDQPVHEGARCHQRHIPERAGAHLLLAGEPFAAEALRVADHRVDLGVLDDLEHAGGLREVGRERLLDQQRNAALGRREDRLDMQVLVGRDDRAGDLGAAAAARRGSASRNRRRPSARPRRRGSGSSRRARSISRPDGGSPPRRGTARRGRRR